MVIYLGRKLLANYRIFENFEFEILWWWGWRMIKKGSITRVHCIFLTKFMWWLLQIYITKHISVLVKNNSIIIYYQFRLKSSHYKIFCILPLKNYFYHIWCLIYASIRGVGEDVSRDSYKLHCGNQREPIGRGFEGLIWIPPWKLRKTI